MASIKEVTRTVSKPNIHRWWLKSRYHKVGTWGLHTLFGSLIKTETTARSTDLGFARKCKWVYIIWAYLTSRISNTDRIFDRGQLFDCRKSGWLGEVLVGNSLVLTHIFCCKMSHRFRNTQFLFPKMQKISVRSGRSKFLSNRVECDNWYILSFNESKLQLSIHLKH